MRRQAHRRAARTGAGSADVFSITATRRSLSEDVRARTRRYLLSMGIRTACFVLAVVFDGWLRWALLAGAILLPYFAVVIANGGREPGSDDVPQWAPLPSRLALHGGPPPADDERSDGGSGTWRAG